MYRELYIVVYGQISDMDQRWRKTKEMRLIDTNITCGAKLIMDKLIFVVTVVAIIPVLIMATVPNVYAGGARDDYPGDATDDEADCWVNGYDDGFAGKYDEDRGRECEKIGSDNYDYL